MNTSARRAVRGFGFDPSESPYHFVVKPLAAGVGIVERAHYGEPDDEPVAPDAEKARLSAYLWQRIETPVASEFNDRLRADGGRAGRWSQGETLLAPHFGKELTLLAWAVEDADPTLVPAMIANWRGLAPEERWWFYTTINATSAHSQHGKDRGWRKAIKIAFADNPVEIPPSALLVGPMPQSVGSSRKPRPKDRAPKPSTPEAALGTLGLFNTIPNPEEPT